MKKPLHYDPKVHQIDIDGIKKIRANVSALIKKAAEQYDKKTLKVLDIAPAEHGGAVEWFKLAQVETLDISYRTNPTYVADICKDNRNAVCTESFGLVVCTEVIEHVLQPFDAIMEIRRILKPGGILILSTPFNFRIHGPLPDCWRFTEHGLRVLLKDFEIIELTALESDRFLAPLHYTVIATKYP